VEIVEITLVKRLSEGDDDRAYLTVDGETRRGPVHVVHDLPHLVVESLFEIGDGLWGELAAGRHRAAGEAATARDPKRRKSGRIVSGAATGARTEEWLTAGHRLAKVVTNAVVNRWGEGPDTPAGVRERLVRHGSPEIDALLGHVGDDTIAAAIRGVRVLEQRWMLTPAGGTLRLTWPLHVSALDDPEPT
jgi:hypothetical protein